MVRRRAGLQGTRRLNVRRLGRGQASRRDRWFVCRHGETVFNATRRLQGEAAHTPLTRTGFAQAEAIGSALAAELGSRPPLALWSSDTGRALQTLAVIAEHLDLDWHDARIDARLNEIDVGDWDGRTYADVTGEGGPIVDPATGLFARGAPGGESYADVAQRLSGWIADTASETGDRLVVMHGMSSRVLRGLVTGLEPLGGYGVPVAASLSQGSLSAIAAGRETVLHAGSGTRAH